jgi:hydroxymethylbilane synthase
VRLTILSRASDLARLQAMLVGRAIEADVPGAAVTYVTRTASGDRDDSTPLAALPMKGVFTADLSDQLVSGAVDLVVHSWKDLPLDSSGPPGPSGGRPDTVVAATLARGDPRDLLLVRRSVGEARPSTLRVLSSSPRREWLLRTALPPLLPWPVTNLEFLPVRGNIATRLTRLVEGRGDALVVAKAAIDRLLGFGVPFEAAACTVRAALAEVRWIVLPTREVPGAPAQGAIAVEVAVGNHPLRDALSVISHEPTWLAVTKERDVLAAHGGGCHEALGATVLPRRYGRIVSVRANTSQGGRAEEWTLVDAGGPFPRADAAFVWPRPDERDHGERRLLAVVQPDDDRGFWVARAEALPRAWTVSPDRFVWAAGGATWRKLAARGIWVHGSAEGLGDYEGPGIDYLAGRRVEWHRLTHEGVEAANALATYVVAERLPDDLPMRTHFFWTSGTSLLRAIDQWPSIRNGWHSSGPGRTWQTLEAALGPGGRSRVSLDYDAWHREVTA